MLTNKQCIFERKAAGERVLVAINADDSEYVAHFDAGCGTAGRWRSDAAPEFRYYVAGII